MDFLSVDSIEKGSHAVCEDKNGEEVVIDYCNLPENIKEGDMIFMDKSKKWRIDNEFTKKRREKILSLRKEIYDKDKKI